MSASGRTWLDALNREIEACERCPRLVTYRQEIAVAKRRAFQDHVYWAKGVPNFGPSDARLLVVGLAPAAHGANRTGRMFTGDRSGEWLYRALHKAGFANQPTAVDLSDGLELRDCLITAVCHCAPPGNRPDRLELAACNPYLRRTLDGTPWSVVVALGGVAWSSLGATLGVRLPHFRHLAEAAIEPDRTAIASYHPSQQNTFTGRLTEPMLDAVFQRARELLSRDE